jgi:hypothetical protein
MQARGCKIGLLMLSLLFAAPLFADTEAMPRSWQRATQDGKHVFVMLGPDWWRESELRGDEITDVSLDYAASGLYRVGDTSDPLYTVDWYAHSVDLSNDGRYVVRHGPWAMRLSDLAVAFYDNGVLLSEYKIYELVPMGLPWDHSVSHFWWLRDREYDPATNELSISTRGISYYTFDATTGSMGWRFPGDYLLLGLLAVLFVVAVWRWRRRRKKLHSRD